MSITKGSPDLRRDLFGGRGEVKVWSLATRGVEPFTAVLSCELAADGSVGRHVQHEFPEIVIGVEGEGEAHVDGAPQRLTAGDVVHLPLGSVLAIVNRSSDKTLRYLIIKARNIAHAPLPTSDP